MDALIGRTIRGISIDDDNQTYITFDTDAGPLTYMAEGDCCSDSWFYHVLGVDNLIGQTVVAVEEIYCGKPPDDYSRQEVDQLYCVKLTTGRGVADVEFRNSSNGYYGGWLVGPLAEGPDGARMVPVTADYTAQLT